MITYRTKIQSMKKDVAYDGKEIKATRMFWTIGKHWDYTEFIDFYHKLEDDIEKLHTHGFTFHLYNQWMAMIEANEDVIKQTFMMLYISVPIIVAIVFGILQKVQATIYVMLMILLVGIDMLGVLYHGRLQCPSDPSRHGIGAR